MLVLLIAVSAIAIDLLAGLLVDRTVSERVVARLRAESALLAAEIESAWPAGDGRGDAWADTAASRLGVRVTLIAADGSVLGDSQVPVRELAALENHLAFPEVAAAAVEGSGLALRHGTGIDRDVEYLATRVGPGSAPLGFVRLAVPSDELRAASRVPNLLLTAFTVVVLALLAMAAYRSVVRFSRPIEKLGKAARDVAAGNYQLIIERDANDEIGDLAASVDRMRRALVERMGRTESESRLMASIFGGLREGILAVDRERGLLLMNEALRANFGIARGLPPGTPMIQVIWDRAIVESFEKALSTGTDVSRRLTRPEGRSFEMTVVPFSDAAGRFAGAIGLFFEVTRLDVLERIRKDFVADISHELRTPLASVRASLETIMTLVDGPADPEAPRGKADEVERFLGILIKNTARMEAILNDLTDLSLIETGAIALSPGPLDVATSVREAAAAIAPRAAARKVAVESRVPAGLVLLADRRRFDQILTNLLDNAVKFNKPGGSVVIEARREGGEIVLTVDDNGPGIPTEALDRVFNRLYRVDRARSQDVPGTGLGLAIVKHLVRLHGGEIRAENRPAGGSRFVLELPGGAS